MLSIARQGTGASLEEVFISYARSGEAVAARVARELEAAGFGVWRDDRLPAHRAYSEVIEQKLRAARAVLVLWSADAAQSQWVRAEADLARSEGKLVQATLDDTLPPIPFNQIQCASLKGWRGKTGHAGWAKIVDSISALVTGEAPKPTARPVVGKWWHAPRTRWMGAVAALLILVAAAFLVPRLTGDKEEGRPVVAVLPFESLAQRDQSLVAGVWEDTRQALSRNPQLLVLGPNTSEDLAGKDSKAARNAADYLVQASVRSVGDRVRVSASLVRTRDDAQVWSDTFERRLDDVFQLQQQIAGEIEGRIRGRLARGGGIKPENIATSGEAYALYSDARAKIRSRDPGAYGEAIRELKQVLAMDSNFAPAWATLAVAGQLGDVRYRQIRGAPSPEQSEGFARRAIALAPNLAAGHAALGLVLGQSPAAGAALRRAVELDPNDVEALNWLANLTSAEGNLDEGAKLYARVFEIEPLWEPAAVNYFNLQLDLGQFAAVERQTARLKALGADFLYARAQVALLRAWGDLSAAADVGLAWMPKSSADERGRFVEFRSLLIQLGYVDEFAATFETPPAVPYLLKGDPKGLELLEKMQIPSRVLFSLPLGLGAARVYLSSGRPADLVQLYRSAASSPEEFASVVGSPGTFADLGALIAVALQREGDQREADRLLATAQSMITKGSAQASMANQAALAHVYAVQGRADEALRLLTIAMQRGWIPPPPSPIDLAKDPTLATPQMESDPRFERLRRQLLGLIRKEKAELGPISLSVRTAAR